MWSWDCELLLDRALDPRVAGYSSPSRGFVDLPKEAWRQSHLDENVHLIGIGRHIGQSGRKLREPSNAIRALAPRIAVAPNGARKGAGAATMKAFGAMPGFEGLWLLHLNVPGGADGNPPAEFIANLDEPGTPGSNDAGAYLKLSAMEDGSFTMFNSRTNATRRYPPRK